MIEIRPGRIGEEVRFAVVMYGGVSLCVYMNGIMQQMLGLVRATARHEADAEDGPFLLADPELKPVERVYRRLALFRTREIDKVDALDVRCRFVVDVLSGTSAGGLNNLFLAHALANEESVDALTRLWIEEGDIGHLLNDAASADRDAGVVAERPPLSLLNSNRMAQRLLQAMRTMEATSKARAQGRSRLVRRLDLYITATDLQGLDQSLRIPSDDTITELRHRAVFHFVHDPDDVGYFEGQLRPGQARNDFVPPMAPFLTFVARATSSIVPAFEPIRMDDLAGIRDPGKEAAAWYRSDSAPLAYSPFFRDYWRNGATFDAADGAERKATIRGQQRAFATRTFGDGGYGDNYPFGYAIDEVSRRPSDYRVDRKFLYVEPDPDLPSLQAAGGQGGRPNVFEHVAAMLSVKTTETIREDIDRLRARNHLLDRLASVQSAADLNGLHDDDRPVAEPVTKRAYLRLRATETTDELAGVFSAALGFEEGSPYAEGVRAIVKAIRVHLFEGNNPRDVSGTERFVDTFDLGVLRRWLRFARQRSAEDDQPPFAGYGETRASLRRLPEIVRAAAEAQAAETPAAGADEGDPNLRRSRAYLAQYARGDLDRRLRIFFARLADLGPLRDPDRPDLGRHISLRDLAALVVTPIRARTFGYRPEPPDAERVEAAWRLIVGVEPQRLGEPGPHYEMRVGRTSRHRRRAILRVVRALAALYRPVIRGARATLESSAPAGGGWNEFQKSDEIMFPVLYGNGNAESTRIDVLRVSPLDCRTLVDDPHAAKRKLAGTGLGHFAGFFKDVWRAEDVLWGRLDGAERLICTVLDADGFARRVLILEAQIAILREDDLDRIVDELRSAPGQAPVPPESRIEVLRAKLLGIALDRFIEWAEEAREIDGAGRLAPVAENRSLAFLRVADPDARREALLKRVLAGDLL